MSKSANRLSVNPKILIGLMFFIVDTFARTQESYLIQNKVFNEKKIPFSHGDTISILINETDFRFDKPTVIYFNGSLPTPQIIELQDGNLMMPPFSYFNFKSLLDKFNLVLISKPFTPVIAKETEVLNSSYIPDLTNPDQLDSNFLSHNNLNYLGSRGSFLIDWLTLNQVISTNRIVNIGHSQGGLEAARVGKLNPCVSDIVMLSAAPFGRAQHVSTNFYLEYLRGKIDFETYLEIQKQILKSIIEEKQSSSETNLNSLSFTDHAFSDMLQTKANIFYISGTKDIAALYADQVMIDAILHNKFNISVKLFEDFDHSFFKVEKTGEVNYEEDRWEEVFEEILFWFEKN